MSRETGLSRCIVRFMSWGEKSFREQQDIAFGADAPVSFTLMAGKLFHKIEGIIGTTFLSPSKRGRDLPFNSVPNNTESVNVGWSLSSDQEWALCSIDAGTI